MRAEAAAADGWSTVASPPISQALCRRKTTMRRKLVGSRRRCAVSVQIHFITNATQQRSWTTK